jgi:hypothetical protein
MRPPPQVKPHGESPVESGVWLSMGKLHGTPWYLNKEHIPEDIRERMASPVPFQQQQHQPPKQQKSITFAEKPMILDAPHKQSKLVQNHAKVVEEFEKKREKRRISGAGNTSFPLAQPAPLEFSNFPVGTLRKPVIEAPESPSLSVPRSRRSPSPNRTFVAPFNDFQFSDPNNAPESQATNQSFAPQSSSAQNYAASVNQNTSTSTTITNTNGNVKPNVQIQCPYNLNVNAAFQKGRAACETKAPNRGRGVLNAAITDASRVPICGSCHQHVRLLETIFLPFSCCF